MAGGICAPKGYVSAAIPCGIKKPGSKKKDLALVYSEVPAAAAGVFTTNKVKAAPVKVSAAHLRSGDIRAVIANSGNANACTGCTGIEHAKQMTADVAEALGLVETQVLVCSTGIIGVPMPMERIRNKIPKLVQGLSRKEGAAAARAIMTSDTKSKSIGVRVKIGKTPVHIGAMAKGAGMICPNMATMLCVVTTDARIEKEELKRTAKEATERSFNRITVDGDMSTNDTVFVLANGLAGNRSIRNGSKASRDFREALVYVMDEMARAIVKDGERVTKFVEVHVRGAASFQDAQKVAEAVANSSLVKCSWNGEDPNWGRIMDVVGYAGARVREELIDIFFDGLVAARNGMASDTPIDELKRVVSEPELRVVIDLHLGDADHTVFTTDLSEGYVAFNRMEYAQKIGS